MNAAEFYVENHYDVEFTFADGTVDRGRICEFAEAYAASETAAKEAAEAERDRAVRALRHLRNEVSGALGMGETGIMAAIGYTNLVVLQTKLAEADEVLYRVQPIGVSPVPVPAPIKENP